jgi:hypothetical protein
MNKNPFWKSLEVIWDNPKLVFVNKEKLNEFAEEWSKEEFSVPSWDDSKNPYDFLEFIGLASSVNFCYRDPYDPEKGRYFFNWQGEKYEGAYGMAVALRTAVERGIPLFTAEGFINCDFLQKITVEKVWNIFCRDFEIPLVLRRMLVLKEIGFVLHNEYNGKFRNIFEKGMWSAFGAKNRGGIIDILVSAFPSFEDSGIYRNGFMKEIICFYKRAQLFLMIYQGRALAYPDKYKPIKDYELLGPPTDYELPKALRCSGILRYDPELANKVDKQIIIVSGSLEEQEIRAQTVNAMLQLLDGINALRSSKINMLSLDYRMWNTGRNIKNIPHHLTPTIAY